MDKETIKILGPSWNTETDTITALKLKRREILQQSLRIFDPLGVLRQITVRAMILMQTIWDSKFEWDEPLPDTIKSEWYAFFLEFTKNNQS